MLKRMLAVLACALAVPLPASAQTVGEAVSGVVLTGWRDGDTRHMAGVRLTLAPGWKTYWRAPGDAGIPPRFDWSGSSGIDGVAAHWPVPDVFFQNGMRSVGYGDVVTIPLEIRLAPGTGTARLEGRMEIGVCRDICIPATLALTAELPPGGGSGSGPIRAALADRPMTAAEAGVGRVTCQASPIDDGMRLSVDIPMPQLSGDEAAVIEFADPTVWVSEPRLSRRGGRLVAEADMVPSHAGPFAVSRQDVRVTVLGGGRAVDIRGCVGPS